MAQLGNNYLYFYYQKKVKKGLNHRWTSEEARISKAEFESLIRRMIAKRTIFEEITRIIRGG